MTSRLHRIADWIPLAAQARYSATSLAKLAQVSRRQLERYWRKHFRESPQSWLNKVRLSQAKSLLQQGMHVKVVAYELGFKQTSHFCRHFKRQLGLTPAAYGLLQMSLPDNKRRSRITKVAHR